MNSREVMPGNYYDLDVARTLTEGVGLPKRGSTGPRAAAVVHIDRLPLAFARLLRRRDRSRDRHGAADCARLVRRTATARGPAGRQMGPNFVGAVEDRIGLLALRLGRTDEAVHDCARRPTASRRSPRCPGSARTRAHLVMRLRAAGQHDEADRVHASALDTATRWACTASAAELRGPADERPAPDVWSLHRNGDAWLLVAGDGTVRLRDSGGPGPPGHAARH